MNLLDKIRYLIDHGYSITFANASDENIIVNIKKCSFDMIQYVSKEAPEKLFLACIDNLIIDILIKEATIKKQAMNMFIEKGDDI